MARNKFVFWIVLCGVLVRGAFCSAEKAADPGSWQWRTLLSGEERFRYEYRHDFDFDKSSKETGSQFYQRLRIGLGASLSDESLDPKFNIFIEGMDAQTGGYQLKANSGQTDDFDLHQAFVNFIDIGGLDLDVKVGRQELKYGRGRLIAAPTWSNRIRSFDAGVVHYHRGGFYADLLYGQDVKFDDNNVNVSSPDEYLFGAYAGYREQGMGVTLEGYALAQSITSASPRTRRYTTGLRFFGKAAGLDYDFEAPFQFGHAQGRNIRAYAVHVDVSKTFEGVLWKPRVAVSYDEASGDRKSHDDATNTFIPLYQTTHEPYGLLDFFR